MQINIDAKQLSRQSLRAGDVVQDPHYKQQFVIVSSQFKRGADGTHREFTIKRLRTHAHVPANLVRGQVNL